MTANRERWLKRGGIALGAAALAGYRICRYLSDPQNYLRGYQGANFWRDALPAGARVRLHNGRIVDVARGRYLPSGVDILLQGDKILALPGLEGQPVDIPAEVTVDLQGRAVIPGLFNAHCHVQMINPALPENLQGAVDGLVRHNLFRRWQLAHTLAECLARGITTVRDALTQDLRQFYYLRDGVSLGEFPGPRLVQSILVSPEGGPLAPSRHRWMDHLVWRMVSLPQISYDKEYAGIVVFPADAGPQQVRDAVDRAIEERGAQCIKIYDQRMRLLDGSEPAVFMTVEQLDVLADRARARGVPTQMHHVSVESLHRAVQVGVGSLEHLPADRLLTKEEARLLADAPTVLIPTLSVVYAGAWPIRGDAMVNHPEMRRLVEYRRRTCGTLGCDYWIPQLRQEAMRPYSQLQYEPNLITEGTAAAIATLLTVGLENLRRLYAAGVTMGCGNDAGAMPSTPAMVREELGMFDFVLNVGPGVSRFTAADVLRVATLHSARALSLGERLGSIEPGKVADLVVLDGDPLANTTLIGSRAAAVWMDGRLVVDNCGLAELIPAKPQSIIDSAPPR